MSSQSLTETVILHCRPGTNLCDTESPNPLRSKFLQLAEFHTKYGGPQPQYWGHIVEQPNMFVWTMYWESMDAVQKWITSEDFATFISIAKEVFDMETEGNEQLILVTNWKSSIGESLKSKVTEVALYTLPEGFGDKEKNRIEEPLVEINENAVKVGKATGAATGFVSFVNPPNHPSSGPGQVIALHGLYGYESVDAHTEWTKQPEFAKAMEEVGSAVKETGLGFANIDGRHMFHVHFEEYV